MDSSTQFINMVQEALSLECCLICGKNHSVQDCDYIKIEKHVPDTPIPTRARLTLPDFIQIQKLNDGSYVASTRAMITRGTQFGPLQAERTQHLPPSVVFPLKVFTLDENACEWYLDNSDEEKCNWLMYVGAAGCEEEQNLICYQGKEDIYYVAIKDIKEGTTLKVWYSPYYASKMNKSLLRPRPNAEDLPKPPDVNSLIRQQQRIMERKVWTCKFCSQIENSIVSFARHILKHYAAHHKNMCEICKKTFGSKKNLKNHMKIVHKQSPPKPAKAVPVAKPQSGDVALGGPLLNDMFADSTDLQNQFDLSLDNQNLLLDNDSLNVENLLNDNVKDLDHFNFEIDDSQKQFVCDICLKQFTRVKLLIVHLRHHTGDFVCYKCLKIFCRKENLRSHLCNMKYQYRCTLCDKTFPQKKYLSRHLQAFHDKKFHCISCNKNYHSNKELQEHNCCKVPDTDKEKFMCPICSKHFYRDIYLKRHLRTHGPRSKITKLSTTCEICGVFLADKNSYYLHKKKHEERTHSCQICDKRFHRKDVLQQHLLTHLDSGQHECPTCQKSFKSKKDLNHHMKNHNSGYSIKCPNCEVLFKNRSSLNKHINNYHTKKTTSIEYYSCPICNKSIKLRSSVLRHLRKVHADVTNIDLSQIAPKVSQSINKSLDIEISCLLNNAENNLSIQKQAVDSLVEELDIDRKKGAKEKEVCLSIPELSDNYQEITLDKNAYILENGTIVQPQENSDNVIIYVLDQTY